MALRAVVIGAGWAGEGHTLGLRDAGVEVVALCGRTRDAARARARELRVDEVCFDWRAAVDELQPDIVCIATPGDTHRAMVEHAAARGCHIVCEKPLAVTAADAHSMLAAVERAGVRHGYAATGCYSPATLLAERLVAEGAIGRVLEIESYERFAVPATLPYSWGFDNARGGGLLRNIFPHKLSQVLRVTGGHVAAALGVATMKTMHMPVAPMIHDFRQLFGPIESWTPEAATEWREAESDIGYTLVVDLAMPNGHTARALFHQSAAGAGPFPSQLTLVGERGTLAMGSGHHDNVVRRYDAASGAWEDLSLPAELRDVLPAVDDPVQRAWNLFFRTFVADVRGAPAGVYPTFRDGVIAMELIETALAGRGWTAVPRGENG